MTILGLYWCIKAYIDWQEKPVLTTITTTAFPVKAVRETKQACETDTSNEKPVFYLSVFQLIPEWAKNCKILTFLNSCNSYSFSFPKNIILTSMGIFKRNSNKIKPLHVNEAENY